MSDVRLCPSCGTRRMGAFRYCLGCRLDFDSLGSGARVPSGTQEPSWPDPDDARAAIRAPGFGAPPGVTPVRTRRLGRPGSVGWMTHAVASIGIIALIGVAFQSTGVVPLDVALQQGDPGGAATALPGTPAATSDAPIGAPAPTRPGGTSGAAVNPTRRPAAPAPRVVTTPVAVTTAASTLRGSAGTATWSALDFKVSEARLTWSATSEQRSGCALRWTLERPNGRAVKGQLKVNGKSKDGAQRVVKVTRGTASLVVSTDCTAWSVVIAGTKRG